MLHGTTANADGTVTLESERISLVPRPSGAPDPLRRLRSNPRYFTADGMTAVYLTGSHTWVNLVDGSPTDPTAEFDYGAYLANLKRWHHNFIRLWAWDVTFDTYRGDPPMCTHPSPTSAADPARPSTASPKFDLSRLNQAYFDRLRGRIVQARRAGIYVAIMIFEGYMPDKGPLPSAHQGHPFAAGNTSTASTATLTTVVVYARCTYFRSKENSERLGRFKRHMFAKSSIRSTIWTMCCTRSRTRHRM